MRAYNGVAASQSSNFLPRFRKVLLRRLGVPHDSSISTPGGVPHQTGLLSAFDFPFNGTCGVARAETSWMIFDEWDSNTAKSSSGTLAAYRGFLSAA